MKKMNNKGFAISSLLYGLLLVAFLIVAVLMSIMASNRQNTSTLIDKIDEELSRHSNTATDFIFTGDVQEYIVPYGKSGWYKIELWGGSGYGLDHVSGGARGRGAYTSGVIYLEANDRLYFYIGAEGASNQIVFNQINSSNKGGGGATDVRLVSGGSQYNDTTSKDSIIMLAGGGATTAGATGGYYADSVYAADGNGASFISGYGGQRVVGNKAFSGGFMFTGVNAGPGRASLEMISNLGPSYHSAARSNRLQGITRIKSCIYNSSSFTYTQYPWTEWNGIATLYGSYSNFNVLKNATFSPNISGLTDGTLVTKINSSGSNVSSPMCVTSTLASPTDLDEVALFHNSLVANYGVTKEEITLYTSGSEYKKVYDYTAGTPEETILGRRITDFHPEGSSTLPKNNYLITLGIKEGMVITGPGTTSSTDYTKLSYYDGSKTQLWTIESQGSGRYSIVSVENRAALQPQQADSEGNFESGAFTATLGPYTGALHEQWNIIPISTNSEYYIIKNVKNASFCLTATSTYQNSAFEISQCEVNKERQIFRLYNAEF